MKELIEIFKNFTTRQWLNIVFAMIVAFGYYNYQARVKQLEEDVKVAREGREKMLELYKDCVNKK